MGIDRHQVGYVTRPVWGGVELEKYGRNGPKIIRMSRSPYPDDPDPRRQPALQRGDGHAGRDRDHEGIATLELAPGRSEHRLYVVGLDRDDDHVRSAEDLAVVIGG